MKTRIRVKGKYADGRKRYVIEYIQEGKIKSFKLPNPEELLYILKCPDISR